MMRVIKRIIAVICVIVLIVVLVPVLINGIVCGSTKGQIVSQEALQEQTTDINPQAIVVLGAGINYDGSPSTILKDRLDVAISLYGAGVAPKIIMTGDNTLSTYNEVMAMTNYAIKQGVSKDDIFCDHAGVSTYDSMYRVRNVFGVESCVVVTQEYHLYRALYDAHNFDIDAVGVKSDIATYADRDSYEKREFLARLQDFAQCLTNAEPDVKSEPVPLNQSGTITQWWR